MADPLPQADDELLGEFLEETREMVAAIRRDRQRLRNNPDDPEIQKRLLELVHTTKGACGFLPLPRLEALGTAAADFTDALYDGRVPSTPGARLVLVGLLDRMHDLLEAVHANGREPAGNDRTLIDALDGLLHGKPPPAAELADEPGAPPPAADEAAPAPTAIDEPVEPSAGRSAEPPVEPAPLGVRPCLVFRAGDGGPLALDLAAVSWLDVVEIEPGDAGGLPDEAVLRDALTRLVCLKEPPEPGVAGAWPVIVLDGPHRVGLVVDEIVDVYGDPADAGEAVEFIDPKGYSEG